MILLEDDAAVEMARNALMIGYAEGDSRTSVTQNVSLPTAGANGVSISWGSSDAARVSTTGTVTRPDDMDTEVILTATLTKNAASDIRRFILTVTLPCGTTSELVTKLQAMPPSLSGCPAAGIRGANMTNLVSAGVTKEQLLAVWSADQDTGFTSAQLKAAGVTVAEMRSHGLTIAQLRTGGIADYLVFNEACNTTQTSGGPTVTLKKTPLTAMDETVVLVGKGSNSARWSLDGDTSIIFVLTVQMPGDTNTLVSDTEAGRYVATGSYVRNEGTTVVSELSIDLDDVLLYKPTVTFSGNDGNTTTQLCPGS